MDYNVNDIIEYTVMLISEFAKRFAISMQQAYRYIHRFGGVAFIEKNYGIMHTLSFDDAIDGVVNYCVRQGGRIQ